MKLPKKIKLIVVIPLMAVIILVGGFILWQGVHASAYDGKIIEGVKVGQYNFSGMTPEQAKNVVEAVSKELEDGGLSVSYTDALKQERFVTIFPSFYLNNQQERFITVNVDDTVSALMGVGRYGSAMRQWESRLFSSLFGKNVEAHVQVDTDLFEKVLQANIASSERLARNAQVRYFNGKFTVTEESSGVTYPMDDQVQDAVEDLQSLSIPKLELEAVFQEPTIVASELSGFAQEFEQIIALGPITLTYSDDDYNRNLSWAVPKHMIAQQLSVDKDQKDRLYIKLAEDEFNGWLKENVLSDVEREAQDAQFILSADNKKVTTFVASHQGIQVDKEELSEAMAAALGARHAQVLLSALEPEKQQTHTPERIELVTVSSEPELTTEKSNKLGIKEVIGLGVSDFSGSPHNRIKNMSNAVDKLQGILIAPGEEFSLLNSLKPFTYSNGYLDELVIKGDEIKPEIAGGLCQIGTTSFRMAMNSGLNITQRRNHSLVVSYYNDPINGNPGTDATIYDPAPDFRFINDTGKHVMWQTTMNTRTGRLAFTLWGTSDGRKGSYTAPVVDRWIATGPMVEKKTVDLEPGQRECQSKHPGAEASFTYSVVKADGTKKQTVYESYYRPLPEICLVGATQEQIDQQEEEKKQEELADILFPDTE